MSDSYMNTLYGGRGYEFTALKDWIGAHALAVAVVIALLIILVIILAYYLNKYKKKCAENFITAVNNMTTGNNNPLWHLGNMDAGNWGPMHRDPTAWNVAAYHPSWRASESDKEGMIGKDCSATQCNCLPRVAGRMYCCRKHWDPSASVEAEALATAGSFSSYMPESDVTARKMIDATCAAYDPSRGISDEALALAIHSGAAS
jgi:hypothetical protein